MKEVHYHSWLSNPIMVKKHDDNWRMCVDFKDLNKACPKDGYPLPEIDWKVESLCGYPYKCFLDAYKGYHQIKMAEEDEEKTAFITSQGIFCYSKMPFGLKNARATYQCLVDKDFQKQIRRNLEVYVDDLVIKIQTKKEVIRDAEETFKTLRKINMKLNPKKCVFGMREGTLLGYKVDADGLRVSPDKVKAIIDLPSPKCLKDVQKLDGKLASLNRFLSKSAEKSLPFFKTLKKCTKKSDFQWTPKTEEAFKEIKQSIAKLPMLMTPNEKEELIIYLAAAKEAICAVLMTGRDGKQVPIYFVSRALQGPKINYTPMEKLILALVSAREHDIQYRPRTLVKGQILADFIVERPEDGTPDTPMEKREELPDPWILFTDGSSCMDGSGAGLIIVNPKGNEFTYALRFRFNATNNEAEYEALIAGLWIASQMGIQNLQANVDSKLVANQKNSGKKQLTKEILVVVEEGHTWMTPVYEYLTEGVLPEEKKKARTVRRKAGRYVVINEVLYKKISLAHGCDARNLIRECKDCQVHRPVLKNPQEKLTPITSQSPFYKWGIDIAGPFPEGPDKVKFLIVAIDYFTKWIEAKPVATITGTQVKKTVEVDMAKNNEALGISLDLLEEKREQAAIQEARNKAKMEGYYNARVRSTSFRLGDFVYRNNKASHAKDRGKLGPKWEGPY
nr:reverse transcriptase domain-containing protein [Tanacetum cinerariifolium]